MMVGDAGKIVDVVEKASGNQVDVTTMIATVLIIACVLLFLYKTVWPLLMKYFDEKAANRQETEKYKKRMEDMTKNYEKHDRQMEEMAGSIKQLASSTEKLCAKVDDISGGYKITISVLLDIINCMDGSTSPENCAKEAKEKVNAYFREGKLPPLVD